jgi:hypothetical protein
MNLRGKGVNASDLVSLATAESFADGREPSLSLGNFVKLNSGGPTMVVVDIMGHAAMFAWRDHSGKVFERSFPLACVHRVSPASAGIGGPAA